MATRADYEELRRFIPVRHVRHVQPAPRPSLMRRILIAIRLWRLRRA